MADYSVLTAVNLVFDPAGPALICKTCQYALAVSGSQVTSHLWNKHKICLESRRDITPLIRSLDIPNPSDIHLPPDQSLVHPLLEVYRGHACLTCKYRTINLETMTRHGSSCWPPPRMPLTRRRNPDNLYQDVLLQTWVSGASRKYWIVRRALTHDRPRIFSGSAHLDAIHQRERAHIAACDQEAMEETGVKELELTSPWMERTKWAEVYKGVRRDLLVKISEVRKSWSYDQDFPIGQYKGVSLVSKRSNEQKIWQLMAALDRALDRCEETMRRTGHPILCWLNSGSRTRFYQKPFGFLGRAATRQRYRRLFQRIIPFLFRAYNMSPAVRRSALGIYFTGEQLDELEKVWQDDAWDDVKDNPGNARDQDEFSSDHDSDLEGEGTEEEADEDEENDEDEDQDDDETEVEDGRVGRSAEDDFIDQADEGEGEDGWISDVSEDRCTSNTETPEIDRLAELAFRLSIFLITEVFTNGQPSSSLLVYYSGVLGCTKDGSTFRRPKDYTSLLSALIYVQRLLLLESALPYRAYEYVGLPCRPQHGQLERLTKIRLECMVFGCLTPLGEFLSLRAFGRKLARSDTPSFLVRWSDDGSTLFYDDTSISMDDFRNFGHSLIRRAESLCDTLMFNWFPPVDLKRLRDDMSNTRHGYSFIQHPANDLSTAYLTLSTRAFTAQGDGLLRGDRWDFKAVSEYLKMTEAYQGYLAGTMLTLGGQAPRATEILSLEWCNGQSTERGVYVHDGFMIYVIRHHKAKRSTNNEFTVARFLPAKVGGLLYYYLVYIRPFAAMLQRETSRCRISSSLLFCSPQTPQRPWRSDRLADILVKSSTGVFKKPINIRLYRQLSISITEKHVKKIAKPFNRYDDQSANADPNVVFAWQSGHRPRQRGTTYGLDGAFPSQMQPALLNIYEWASVEWHQYLGHQSRNVAFEKAYPPQDMPNASSAEVAGRRSLSELSAVRASSACNIQNSARKATQKAFSAGSSGFQKRRRLLSEAETAREQLDTLSPRSISTAISMEDQGLNERSESLRSVSCRGGDEIWTEAAPNVMRDQIPIWEDQILSRNTDRYEKRRHDLISLDGDADDDNSHSRNDFEYFEEDKKRFGATVTWTRSEQQQADKDVMHFDGKSLSTRRLLDSILGMIRDAEDVLWHDLMWVSQKKDRFEIDLKIIQDDVSITKRGASWVTNEHNSLTDKNGWMLDQMMKSSRDKWLRDSTKKEWRMNMVHDYAQLRKRFLELLLALIYITSAPPATAEEVTLIRHRNSFLQERNIYVIGGQLSLAT